MSAASRINKLLVAGLLLAGSAAFAQGNLQPSNTLNLGYQPAGFTLNLSNLAYNTQTVTPAYLLSPAWAGNQVKVELSGCSGSIDGVYTRQSLPTVFDNMLAPAAQTSLGTWQTAGSQIAVVAVVVRQVSGYPYGQCVLTVKPADNIPGNGDQGQMYGPYLIKVRFGSDATQCAQQLQMVPGILSAYADAANGLVYINTNNVNRQVLNFIGCVESALKVNNQPGLVGPAAAEDDEGSN